MSKGQSSSASIELAATNIGGIDDTTVTLQSGVNVLEGRNATNRTSLLQAIMEAHGSDRSTLKGDAETGRVELSLDGETATRELHRRNGRVVFDGNPYLADPTLADLFAFLLESNEARRAVEQGADLRDLIMRPIDTNEIEREIRSLEAEKREIDAELDDLDDLAGDLPALEERRTQIEADLEARQSELEERRAELADRDADVSESQDRRDEIESTFEQLREARRELDDIEFDLETERETASELDAERETLEADLADIEGDDAESADELDGRIAELRERKRRMDTTVSELQSVIRFNEDRLEDGGIGFDGAVAQRDGDDGGTVTDQLVEDDEAVTCWTCGSEVHRDHIEETLERLRDIHREKLSERSDIDDRIDDLAERRSRIRERERRREQIETRLAAIDDELDAQETRIEDLEARRDSQRERIDELEAETEQLDDAETDYEAVLDLHREISQAELEIERHRENLEAIEDQIEDVERQLERSPDLEARREAITDELTDLRTRVDRIEADAVEAFNDHMASILGMLEYANIDRIWIERTESSVREGRKTVDKRLFDLHVVRTTDDGATYEDTVDHLSESEREVTGLVFALAGYLVHEVYETVPFMLLDSLEAIDSNRIADLVEYFSDYADCLVVALLPEDADALSADYTYHTDI